MAGDGELGSAFIGVLVGFDLSLGTPGAKLSLLYLLAVVGSMRAVELFVSLCFEERCSNEV